jgi:hypothetical protein
LTRSRRRKSPAVLGVCEGRSEETYLRAVGRFFRTAVTESPPSIKTHVVGGGSSIVVLEEALREWRRAQRIGAPFDFGCVLVDEDSVSTNGQKLKAALERLNELPFDVILQPGSHEAFLLHHFPVGTQARGLANLMPGYQKGCDATVYARHIGREQYEAAQIRYPALAAFFVRCGIVPRDSTA